MFCRTCGKDLREGTKFCDNCGAVVREVPVEKVPEQPVEPQQEVKPEAPKPPKAEKARKEIKKTTRVVVTVSILLILAISAALMYPIWQALRPEREEMVTIYLLSSRKEYVNGELKSEIQVEYDDMGHPVLFSMTGSREMQCAVEYDDHGNRIRETFTEEMTSTDKSGETNSWTYETSDAVEYEYNDEGQAVKATLYHNDTPGLICDLTYDRRGNLTLVEYHYSGTLGGPYWAHFVYDSQGRLVEETFCQAGETPIGDQGASFVHSALQRYSYSYNADGSGVQVTGSYASVDSETPVQVSELDDIDYGREETYDFSFTRSGIPVVLRDDFTLDENGDPQQEGWTFDDHGNLIRIEKAEETVVEYTYEAFRLPKSDAQKAQRMMRYGNLPGCILPYSMTLGLVPLEGMAAPLAFHNVSYAFYYHVIPNPVF